MRLCRKTTMVMNINDAVNNNVQAENLLQIHEKLPHGAISRGMWHDVCAGVTLFSNYKKPERYVN